MTKTETVHTRVTPEIKKEADKLFESLGLTTSQAIMLFLKTAISCNGLPFDLTLHDSAIDEDYEFASSIASVDGPRPNVNAEKIFKLYKRGDIDLETAKFAMKRLYK